MDVPLNSEPKLALITKLRVNSLDAGKYLDWLARLMMAGMESPGALNSEIIPPFSSRDTEWVLVQRFSSKEQIDAWRKSDKHQNLKDELTPYLDSKNFTIMEWIDSVYGTVGSIAVGVVTHVKEGQEAAYFACEGKYQAAQARAPGYRGAYVQPPERGAAGLWTTLIRFDSQSSMDRWFSSEERKKVQAESGQFVRSTDFQNVATSFPGWFPNETKGGGGPPNWKTALLILLGLYPIVMLEIKFLLPLMHNYNLALSNFFGNIVSVALTTWVSMPLFIRFFKSWLFPNERTPRWVPSASILAIVFLLTIEILLFWRLF